jgi:hypothetical protein
MRTKYLAFVLVFGFQTAFAQVQPVTPDANASLNSRFAYMKATSQTFQDYKVIKEVRLDEFWRMTMDSVVKQRQAIKQSQRTVDLLTKQLATTDASVKTIQASMADLVHDSTHISFLGISFNKLLFNMLVLVVVGVLVFSIVLLLGRTRLVNNAMKEKLDSLQSITDEFEQYKRKALEKEKKLSRELQTERNKLLELKRI